MHTIDPTDPGNLAVPEGFVADLAAAGYGNFTLTDCRDTGGDFSWSASAFRKLGDGEPDPVEGDGVTISTHYRSVHLNAYGPNPAVAIGRMLDAARSCPAPAEKAA